MEMRKMLLSLCYNKKAKTTQDRFSLLLGRAYPYTYPRFTAVYIMFNCDRLKFVHIYPKYYKYYSIIYEYILL